LVRRAQAGDDLARTRLLQFHHRCVLKIAGAKYHGLAFQDRVAAGMLGLNIAIDRFDLNRNCRLRTYAWSYIHKEISEAAKEWCRCGQVGETRADRWLYSHPSATPEEVVAAVNCTLQEAKVAVALQGGYWHGHQHYDPVETELGKLCAEEPIEPDDVDPIEPGSGVVTNDDWAYIVRARKRRQGPIEPARKRQPSELKPGEFKFWSQYVSTRDGRSNARQYYRKHGQPIPKWAADKLDQALKPISRLQYATDQAAAYACRSSVTVLRVYNTVCKFAHGSPRSCKNLEVVMAAHEKHRELVKLEQIRLPDGIVISAATMSSPVFITKHNTV
jgi:hypothetical protein